MEPKQAMHVQKYTTIFGKHHLECGNMYLKQCPSVTRQDVGASGELQVEIPEYKAQIKAGECAELCNDVLPRLETFLPSFEYMSASPNLELSTQMQAQHAW